ncbi:MAG TPA: zinc-binding dehydrogenase [Candidatus Dormibacteraeota bacterium]|nr:zinc-binding dehydrogenase [Candidatus Dormibacteraeota bacterium]
MVVARGEGADPAVAGIRVIASTGGSGAYAERVAVDASALIPVPRGLRTDQAVALLADGRTAIALIRSAELRHGQTVLVEAAAGGVGSLLVQLATSAGARVVAAAGGPDKVKLARGLGAAAGIDYTDPGWAERARREVGEVDVVFDGVGGAIGRAAFELIHPGGRLISFGMAGGSFTAVAAGESERRRVTVVRGVPVSPDESRALTADALDRAVRGELHAVIGQTWPLDEAAEAHAAIESRLTVGKTLLVVAGEVA